MESSTNVSGAVNSHESLPHGLYRVTRDGKKQDYVAVTPENMVLCWWVIVDKDGNKTSVTMLDSLEGYAKDRKTFESECSFHYERIG